jgi:hypothetical protein
MLDAFVDAVATRVVEKLGALPTKPRYANAKNNPLESERAFLDAARRGDFETFIRARRVTALWEDVERYVEGRKRRARPLTDDTGEDPERAELEGAGVRLRPRRGSRG